MTLCRKEPGRHIEDRYLTGTRLRLRTVTVGEDSVFKLGQKVRARTEYPADVMLTNLYLDASEFERLSVLPATQIAKTRRFCRDDGVRFAADQFHDKLAGLVSAEVEVDDLAEPLPFADWLGVDVTPDDRYADGSLAALTGRQIVQLLHSGQVPLVTPQAAFRKSLSAPRRHSLGIRVSRGACPSAALTLVRSHESTTLLSPEAKCTVAHSVSSDSARKRAVVDRGWPEGT